MCTLTFVPKENGAFIITSNRDEAPQRETEAPSVTMLEDTRVLFPKDKQAGGTWIGLSDRQRMVCLLNGGFTAHKRAEAYRMSRGLIVRDLLKTKHLKTTIKDYDFQGIEPFTLISVSWKQHAILLELVWDGSTAHFTEKPWSPTIWSSSLLYTPQMKAARETWFASFLKTYPNPTSEDLRRFHYTAGKEHPEYSLIMDRGFVRTKSITQIKKAGDVSMWYQSLPKGEANEIIF